MYISINLCHTLEWGFFDRDADACLPLSLYGWKWERSAAPGRKKQEERRGGCAVLCSRGSMSNCKRCSPPGHGECALPDSTLALWGWANRKCLMSRAPIGKKGVPGPTPCHPLSCVSCDEMDTVRVGLNGEHPHNLNHL